MPSIEKSDFKLPYFKEAYEWITKEQGFCLDGWFLGEVPLTGIFIFNYWDPHLKKITAEFEVCVTNPYQYVDKIIPENTEVIFAFSDINGYIEKRNSIEEAIEFTV